MAIKKVASKKKKRKESGLFHLGNFPVPTSLGPDDHKGSETLVPPYSDHSFEPKNLLPNTCITMSNVWADLWINSSRAIPNYTLIIGQLSGPWLTNTFYMTSWNILPTVIMNPLVHPAHDYNCTQRMSSRSVSGTHFMGQRHGMKSLKKNAAD